jgi:hypothetical protein
MVDMRMFAYIAQADGLTLSEVVRELPHDPASVVGYVLLAVFVGFIWIGMRPERKGS